MARRFTNRLSARSHRPARGQSSATGKAGRRKRGPGRKREPEGANQREGQPVSLLVYDPQVALEELKARHRRAPAEDGLESIRAQVYEHRAARARGQPAAVRMGLSRKICRFELPMDINELDSLCPQDYLRRFCIVCSRRSSHYRKSFHKFDRDRDGVLSFREMEGALRNVYMDELSSQQVRWLAGLVVADSTTLFDSTLFCALCALSERLFYSSFVTEDTEAPENGERSLLEEADFCSLTSKLRSCNIHPSLKTLLSLL
ncbi:uncharacterized protein [Lepisosteus oculatus]|uniref:uncharacterized protein n=1 Tax=Lepisosteus oculatus TaxID=7918 RepID=UPI003723EA2D